MDKFFALLWKTPVFQTLCATSAVLVVAGHVTNTVELFLAGIALLAVVSLTYIWEDSKQYPEIR